MKNKIFLCSLLIFNSFFFAHQKVAFITGGASGIGADTVDLFMKHGMKVVFIDWDGQKGHEVANRYSSEDILFIEGDCTQLPVLQAALIQTIGKFGSLDIVFANAGMQEWMERLLTMLKGPKIIGRR